MGSGVSKKKRPSPQYHTSPNGNQFASNIRSIPAFREVDSDIGVANHNNNNLATKHGKEKKNARKHKGRIVDHGDQHPHQRFAVNKNKAERINLMKTTPFVLDSYREVDSDVESVSLESRKQSRRNSLRSFQQRTEQVKGLTSSENNLNSNSMDAGENTLKRTRNRSLSRNSNSFQQGSENIRSSSMRLPPRKSFNTTNSSKKAEVQQSTQSTNDFSQKNPGRRIRTAQNRNRKLKTRSVNLEDKHVSSGNESEISSKLDVNSSKTLREQGVKGLDCDIKQSLESININKCATETMENPTIPLLCDDDGTTAPTTQSLTENKRTLLGYEPCSYIHFPTATILRGENLKFHKYLRDNQLGIDQDIPYPHALDKKENFNWKRFRKIDNFALKAPAELIHCPLEEVVRHLTNNLTKEIEKVRVLFRWAAAQNLQNLPALNEENVDYSDEKTTLWKLHQLKEEYLTHAEFLEMMFTLSGITCLTVKGYVKGMRYEVGNNVISDITTNAKNDWTLVRINGCWWPIDLNFASRQRGGGDAGEWPLMGTPRGRITLSDPSLPVTVHTLNEAYFLTNPEQFIVTHLPEDSSHQLLARTVSPKEFQDMAYIWCSFFDLGLEVTKSSMRGVLELSDGEVDIDIKLPEKGQRRFMYQLWRSNTDGKNVKDFKGFQLNQFVFLQQKNGHMQCNIRFPFTGKYKLELYCRNSANDLTDKEDRTFDPVVKYLILCNQPKVDPVTAYPENRRVEWGPGADMALYGIAPVTHNEAVIETNKGIVELTFKIKKPICSILPQLRNNDVKMMVKLRRFVLYYENNGMVTVNIKLPKGGYYALDIYGPAGPDGGLPLLCTYLIRSTDGACDVIPFPVLPHQKAGATCRQEKLGLVPLTHKESYFTSQNGRDIIKFQTSTPMSFNTELILQDKIGTKDIKNHVFIELTDEKVTFKLRFPFPGSYLLSIYGREKVTAGDEDLPNVYNYVINVPLQLASGLQPFPEVFTLWRDGCQITGNEDSLLPCEEDAMLSFLIPGAVDVVIIGKEWTKLNQTSSGQWEGLVYISSSDDAVQLAAAYEKNGNYVTLLRYKTKCKHESETERKELLKLQKQIKEKENEDKMKMDQFEEKCDRLLFDLKEALASGDLEALCCAVRQIELINCTQRHSKEHEEAKRMIESGHRVLRLNEYILNLSQSQIKEMSSLKNPPPIVKDVMMSTLFLLSENADDIQNWEVVQAMFSTPETLHQRVELFRLQNINMDIVQNVQQMLCKYSVENVSQISKEASSLYLWCAGILEEYLRTPTT